MSVRLSTNLPLCDLWDMVASVKTVEDVTEAKRYIKINFEINDEIRSELIDSLMFRMMDIKKTA